VNSRKHRLAAQRQSTRRSWLRFETLEARTLLAGDLGLKSELLAPAAETGWYPSAVYAPDTDPKILELFPDVFSGTPTGGDDRLAPFVFGDTNRWSVTATNGGGLLQGDPTTITWSIVPDGTPVGGFNGEPASPSDLIGFLGNIYGTNTNDANLTDEPWFGLFQSYLQRWSELSGISYVYEPNDDGISLNAFGSQGVLGVRGDMRISGHFIDGNSNILAYNFFPNGGDMVIDTGDVNFYSSTANNSRALRNVLAHENGHGLGLDHVCPVITGPNGRLMEPFINLSIDGPQFDDILAVHRGYGDVLEKNGGNDSFTTAVALGPLSTLQAIVLGADAVDVQVAPTEVGFVSIDDDSDVDFFSFTVGAGLGANIQLTPMGPTYLSGPQNSNGSCSAGSSFNAAMQSDLALQLIGPNGSTVLSSSNVTGLGGTEQIVSGLLAPGTYYVRVSGNANAAQMYRLSIIGEQLTGVLLTESEGQTVVSESGTLDTYTLQLGAASNGSVQVTVTSDGQSQISSDGVNFANTAVVNLSDTTPRTITVRAVDDTLSEGLHSSLISHAITATEDPLNYPLNLSLPTLAVTVLDNDLAQFVRRASLGSLMATSDNNTGFVASPSEPVDLSLFLTAGQTLAATAHTSDGAALLSLTLVGQAGPFTAPSLGASAVLPATTISTTGNYVLRISANAPAPFTLQAILNAVVESLDTANGSALSLSPSAVTVSNSATRWAAIGTATPTSQPLAWNTSNNPSLFVNIAGTGTPLNLTDDGIGFINTRVGNSIFPAGSVSVSNNGVVAAGIVQQISFDNSRLPSNQFGTALVPFWDDLDATSGNVYWEQRTVGGIEALIVQWDNRPHYSGSGPVGAATIQVQLFASGPVLARYVYPDVDFGNGFFNSGASATIGYQSSPASALSYSFNTPLIVNGTVLELHAPVTPDVDEFEVDLSPYVGRPVDVILTGIDADFSQQELQLLAPDEITVLASGTSQPLGITATNLDLAITDFVVPAPGIYTLRVASGLSGSYGLLVSPATTMDIEPNDAVSNVRRSLNTTRRALGYLSASNDPAQRDSEDQYQLTLAAGQTISLSTRTPFDLNASTPRNDLDPRLSILASDGMTELVNSLNTASDGRNTGLSFTAPAAGNYIVRVAATSGSGEYLLLVDEPVTIAQAIVNSTTWHPSFQDYIDGGLNDGKAEGFRVPNGSVTSIPWLHVNQVKLPFNAEVGASLSVNDFVLTGRFGYDSRFVPGVVPPIEAVDWDPNTKIATLRLAASLGPNLVEITALANGITTADGVPLSRNHSFSFFILPGDAWDDHVNTFGMYSVDGIDSIYIRDRLAGQLIDLPGTHPLDGAYFGYDPRADVDGDGFVNSIDRIWVRENLTYFIIVIPEVNAVSSLAVAPISLSDSTPMIFSVSAQATGGGADPSLEARTRVRPVVSRFIGSHVVQLSPAATLAAPLITRATRFLVPRAAVQPAFPSAIEAHAIATESQLTSPFAPPER